MLGKVLGNRYEILEKVGIGGMAVVYKAKDRLLNRFIAVKVLRDEYINDQEFLDKFRMEAQSAASLSHSNIVNIYDVGAEEDMPYIVMEFVSGVTLKEYIEKFDGFLKNQQIADFSRQIALALEHAHSNRIIHRDIKPHNIMVSNDGTLKVADFGIASAITEATTSYTGEAIGSVRYSSPEQARGRNVDIRTDLYSLGVLMYEMATRQVPFEGETAVEIALKHMKDDIVPPSEINSLFHKGLESVVMRSLLKNINERYQTARELIDDLNKIINNPNENVAFYDFESDSPTQKIPSLEAYDIKEGEKRTMKKKKQQTGLKLPNKQVIYAIGVVLLAFITVLIVFIFNNLEPESTEPTFVYLTDVVGLPLEEAKSTLIDEGYEVIEGISEKDNTVDAGAVSSMRPPAGSKLKPGFKVTLNVSEGASKAVIPNLVFKTLDDAEVLLKNTKFTIGDITYVNEDLDKGYILSQDPPADTETKDDAVINLTVSLGPEHTKVIVPRLTDLTLQEAQEKLAELGLTIDQITYEEHLTIEKDQIISQSVPEGTEVEMTRMIDVVISTGNEEEVEETDDDSLSIRNYVIPLGDYIGQEVTIRVIYEKAGKSENIYSEVYTVTEDGTSKLIEVEGSGSGILNFFVNDSFKTATEVDFSN